jgi:hypothetical protein
MGVAQEPETARVPTFYANGANFLSQVYDFQIDFTLQNSRDAPRAVVASIHMSPQLAKVVGRLIRQHVKAYEEQTGVEIQLPEALLKELKIADLRE